MNPNIFKSYDIRGKYPQEINEKIVSEIILKLSNKFSQKSKIVIGYDARLSSLSLYRAAINSVKRKASSIKIIEIEMATTPMLYFLANYFNADMGIIITASHNPKEYNGLKIVGKNAIPISGKEIFKIMDNE
ncbi:MAG: hypothetical protein AAB396_00895 [Patescibacteria group bacterium]